MLLQSKNIFAQIAQGEIEISAVYFWVLLGVIIVLFIYLLQKTNQILDKRNKTSEVPEVTDEPVVAVQNSINTTRPINGEEVAAIAMALSLYKKEFDRKLHLKTTIQRVSKAYSPWNSKIYTLRQNPRN
jgi:hypothetical protein